MDILVFRRMTERGKRIQENAVRGFEAWQADQMDLLNGHVAEMRRDAEAASEELIALEAAIASGVLEE